MDRQNLTKYIRLGVNLDHLATIREARHTPYPDLVEAIRVAETAGADGITIHLREDRRHIQTRDVYNARTAVTTSLNLEMSVSDEMIDIAKDVKPDYCCLVPERREELTTEGGLDVRANKVRIQQVCDTLSYGGIKVSLFVEPAIPIIDIAAEIGAPIIELHTGTYANATETELENELNRLRHATDYATDKGLQVNAGHGLHYHNVGPIAAIQGIQELNIGHSIIARALFIGLADATAEMKAAMEQARES